MRRMPLWATVILGLVPASSWAGPPDPARFIPAGAEVFARVDKPRELVQAVTERPEFKKLYDLEALKPLYQSVQYRRFLQLVAYYERDLGSPWPELLDKLAGGGVALGVKYYTGGKTRTVLAVQSTDAETLKQFFDLALKVVEQEAARGDEPAEINRGSYGGVDGVKLGGAFMAIVDGAFVLASDEKAMKAAIDLRNGGKSMADSPEPKKGRDLLPGDPLAWVYANIKPLKALPQAKEAFAKPRDNFLLTFAFAGILDVVGRSDFVTAGVYAEDDKLGLRLRMPAGREGMGLDAPLHVPPVGKPGSLPLLAPEGTIFSHSFYLDLKTFWVDREKILPPQVAKQFEQGIKQASRFTLGTTLGEMLEQSGVHHRFVVAAVPGSAYKVEPAQKIPAFAFVTTLRDEKLGRSLRSALLAAGGFAALTPQVSIKLHKDEYKGVKVTGYRFKEGGKFPVPDTDNLRFNFSPCFAQVGDQFIISSKEEFIRALIDELRKPGGREPASSNMRMRLSSAGASKLIEYDPDQIMTQLVLDQALPVPEAKKQARQLIDYLASLGQAELDFDFQPGHFELSLMFNFGN